MADENIKISELPYLGGLNATQDAVPVAHQVTSNPATYETGKVNPEVFSVYDNRKSRLQATTFQDAIDELAELINNNSEE
jgi:hypothetical protein